MTIKKLGHCCLLIKMAAKGEKSGPTILTDPGIFTTAQDELKGIDIVLITHEHTDHLHVPSVQAILKNNPGAKVITNTGVGKQLAKAGIPHEILEGRANMKIQGVTLEAFDCKHEEIYDEWGLVQNTGYMIGGKLFYPGDSFFAPGKPVNILALPVAGPWCRIPDALHYAVRVKPRMAFPVHDGMVKTEFTGFMHRLCGEVLKQNGIDFTPMGEGIELEG